jgi:naphthalene 1,2-dioxygenase ferredoxin component
LAAGKPAIADVPLAPTVFTQTELPNPVAPGKDAGMSEATNWVTVARRADVPAGQVKGVKVGKQEIALYNLDGEYYATDNVCSHAYAQLSDGFIERGQIVCPLHAGCFDIKTGKALEPPAEEDIKIFPTRLNGDDIQVAID